MILLFLVYIFNTFVRIIFPCPFEYIYILVLPHRPSMNSSKIINCKNGKKRLPTVRGMIYMVLYVCKKTEKYILFSFT